VVDELVGQLRTAATAAGCAIDKLTFEIRDALDHMVLPRYERTNKRVKKQVTMRRGQLIAYARSLLSLFCWNPEEPFFWPSYETIAERLGLSMRAAIDLMGRLQEAGLITPVKRLYRSAKHGWTHERGEATTNVWVWTLPAEAFQVLQSVRSFFAREATDVEPAATETTAPSIVPVATPAPTLDPPAAPAAPAAPRATFTEAEAEQVRQLIFAEPVLSKVDPLECLEKAVETHGAGAVAAVIVGLTELAGKGWGRNATQAEANRFAQSARLAAGATAQPKETVEDVLKDEARQRREDEAHRAASLPRADVGTLLKTWKPK
jgi:hypothetical protein